MRNTTIHSSLSKSLPSFEGHSSDDDDDDGGGDERRNFIQLQQILEHFADIIAQVCNEAEADKDRLLSGRGSKAAKETEFSNSLRLNFPSADFLRPTPPSLPASALCLSPA